MIHKVFERGFFWYILSNQSNLIFIQSTLLWRIRIAKENVKIQVLSNLFMVGKFFSIINGQGFNPTGMIAKHSFNRALDFARTAVLYFKNKLVFGFHLCKRYYSSLVIFTNDGISLQIPNPGLIVSCHRSFVDNDPIGNNPSAILKVLSLPSLFMSATKMKKKLTATSTILINEFIDRLMANHRSFFFGRTAGNLFWTPIILNPFSDLLFNLRSKLSMVVFGVMPEFSLNLCPVRIVDPVTSSPLGRVAMDFSGYCRRRSIKFCGYFKERKTGFQQNFNHMSFDDRNLLIFTVHRVVFMQRDGRAFFT